VTRLVVVAAALALLPPACAKLLGKAPPEAEAVPPPPPEPLASATTPPAWRPPETSAATADKPGDAGPAPVSAELVKARAAADAKDFKKVRALLEKKVRAGRGAPEEAQLVLKACTALKDKSCTAEVRAKHADDLVE
jgi:hypothetical protein